MKITVTNPGSARIRLRFPTVLLLNRFTVGGLCRAAAKHGVPLSRKQALALIRAVGQYRRVHPGWTLMEVSGSSGECVCISL